MKYVLGPSGRLVSVFAVGDDRISPLFGKGEHIATPESERKDRIQEQAARINAEAGREAAEARVRELEARLRQQGS